MGLHELASVTGPILQAFAEELQAFFLQLHNWSTTITLGLFFVFPVVMSLKSITLRGGLRKRAHACHVAQGASIADSRHAHLLSKYLKNQTRFSYLASN